MIVTLAQRRVSVMPLATGFARFHTVFMLNWSNYSE